MLIDDFSAAFSEEEHSVKQVHNDKKKKNILPLPIFFVDLHPKDTDHEV